MTLFLLVGILNADMYWEWKIEKLRWRKADMVKAKKATVRVFIRIRAFRFISE